ncbi:hypothetical protein KKB99_01015 [bacterium]|nr:hypothetical protein [bacterium]MBU1024566.1 hypothetical protein [bacterium]
MPFPSKKKELSSAEWIAQIRKAADSLAERFSLDKKRVRKVFRLLDAAEWHYPNFPQSTFFDIALKYLEPNNALY